MTEPNLPEYRVDRSDLRARKKDLIAWGILGVILVVHLVFILSHWAPGLVGPDANGYWAQGTRLAHTGRTWFVPENDVQYIGMHWLVTPSDRYYSRYPPGLAVITAITAKLFGYRASLLINPLMATLTLLALFMIVRRRFGPEAGIAGVLVLAVNPLFNQQAIEGFAHMAVACCLAWALWLLFEWEARGKLWQVCAAGAVAGIIPTLRYPEVLYGLGFAAFVLWQFRSRPGLWKHALAAAGGAMVPILALLIRNQAAFGAFWRTGYALTNEQTGFGWDYFASHFTDYITGLQSNGVGLFFALGLIGILLMIIGRETRRLGVLLTLIIVPSTLLYMAYYWGRGAGGAGMRFLLPTFIAYVIPGLWLVRRLTLQTGPRTVLGVTAFILLVQFAGSRLAGIDELRNLHHQQAVLARITTGLEANSTPGDLVLADDQVLQHLDFAGTWRLVDMNRLREGRRPRFDRQAGRDPDAPAPMQAEKEKLRSEAFEGMDRIDLELEITGQVTAWAEGHKVWFVGTEEELDRLPGISFHKDSFKVIARVELPEPPARDEPAGDFGGRGGRPGPDGGAPPMGPDAGPMPAPGTGQPGRFNPAGRHGGMGGGGGMGRSAVYTAREAVIAEWIPGAGKPAAVTADVQRSRPPEAAVSGPRVHERVRKLHALVQSIFARGESPDFFWPPEREQELRELLDRQAFDEANALLDRARSDYERKQ